ncbi:MAG: hypothetical protein HYT87_05660 [Nitrospirae bacterium]|nr:hypothetical protein [Nitrospirota bacterium]
MNIEERGHQDSIRAILSRIEKTTQSFAEEGRVFRVQAEKDRLQAAEDRRQAAEDRRQAAEDRRQAAEDRRQAAEDRKEWRQRWEEDRERWEENWESDRRQAAEDRKEIARILEAIGKVGVTILRNQERQTELLKTNNVFLRRVLTNGHLGGNGARSRRGRKH